MEICFTDLVHECGNPQCAEEVIRERCPGFELVGYTADERTPTVAELIRLLEEEGSNPCA